MRNGSLPTTQALLYDRIHGFWGSSSQIRPVDLEPGRTAQLVSSNISTPAIARILTKLSALVARRSQVHETYLGMVRADAANARSQAQRQQRRRRTIVSSGPPRTYSMDAVPAATSIQASWLTWSKARAPVQPSGPTPGADRAQAQPIPPALPISEGARVPAAVSHSNSEGSASGRSEVTEHHALRDSGWESAAAAAIPGAATDLGAQDCVLVCSGSARHSQRSVDGRREAALAPSGQRSGEAWNARSLFV